jgi:quinoprotein glucose dehydrogenase
MRFECTDGRVSACVLPDDRVVPRAARSWVPHHGRLALIGHTDGRQVAPGQTRRAKGAGNDFVDARGNLGGIVFDPSRFRQDLLVFELPPGYLCAGRIEHHEARAGGSLVECSDVHGGDPRSKGKGQRAKGKRAHGKGKRAYSWKTPCVIEISGIPTNIHGEPIQLERKDGIMSWLTPSARILASLLVVLMWTTVGLPGQTGAKNGEWPTYGGDLGHTRYAPLDQIHAANFSKLEVAWRFKTDNLGPRPEFNLESTPLMVKGVLYSTGGTRRAVVALDAATGEQLWMHSENEGPRGAAAPRQLSGRGLAYWSDGREERILYVTPGYRLIALDARTGQRIPTFGKDGVVDLKEQMDQPIDPLSPEIGLHSTPIVARNVVLVGAAHKSGGVPTGKTNIKGYIRGFDVRTGKRLWVFHTIPSPGEYGNETWEKDSWSYTGNTGAWSQISVDEELGIAYLPIESATGDYYGGNRPGANLFAESLVAVDLQTGKRRWHFQFVHHGIWDMDMSSAPILADITVNGRPIKAVAVPTKQAFLYVFNRETGEPVWPIEERPVPKGDVPGEWYSPTQPFPTKPPAYERQGLQIEDLIDFTPELRAEAIQLVSKYKIGPIFTPPVVSKIDGPLTLLAMATAAGGTNWPGGSYDPETGILYVSSTKTISQLGLVAPDPAKNDFGFVQGNAATGVRTTGGSGAGAGAGAPPPQPAAPAAGAALTVRGLPLVKPPYGSISAIDLNKGEIVWQVAHGETPDVVRNHPALKGLNIPRTGRTGTVGTLVTRTLVISGEAGFGPTPSGQRGAMLRAYDKATGKEVGAIYMPAPQSGSPMTYMLNGRQYIVVAISGGTYSGELLALRLPE